MNKIITTLPISPPQTTTLAHVVSTYVASTIKHLLGEEYTLMQAMNVMGWKTNTMTKDEISKKVSDYMSSLKAFGINADDIRIDKNKSEQIKNIMSSLISEGYIKEQSISISKCPTGCVEMIHGATHYGKSHNLVRDNYCTKCHKEIKNEEITGLIYTVYKPDIQAFPKRYQGHINDYDTHFNNKQILISRTRETGQTIQVHGKTYNLDIDFCRSTWLIDIHTNESMPEIVICNPSSLYKAYIAISLYNQIKQKDMNIIVHPYINLHVDANHWSTDTHEDIRKQGLKHHSFSINAISQKTQNKIYQLFIASGLKRGEDNVNINSNNLKHITKIIEKLGNHETLTETSNLTSLEDILNMTHGNKLTNLIQKKGNSNQTCDDIGKVLSVYYTT